MADIRLSINGENNASGALRDVAGDVSGLGAAAGIASTALAAAATATVAFGAAALKAYADAERVSKQLERAAGGMTSAFERQAGAIQNQLGVSDELVKKMQMVLIQYGEAPADIDATVRALLDYSAATGVDALAATETLTRGVEGGRAVFKELGITYDKTGDKTSKLTQVTEALRAKLGGAAATDADTLAGATRAVKEQFGEMLEGFGALIAGLIAKSGALDSVKQKLIDFRESVGMGSAAGQRNMERDSLLTEQILLMKREEYRKANPNYAFMQGEEGAAIDPAREQARAKEIRARLAQLADAQKAEETLPTAPKPKGVGEGTGTGTGAGKPKYSELPVETRWREGNQRHFQEQQRQFQEDMRLAEIEDNLAADKQKRLEAHAKQLADHAAQEAERAAKANEEAAKRTEEAWKQASETVAVSLIQNVGGALQDLAEGNQVSAKGLLSGILGTLGSLIPGFGAIGSAIGQQVGGLVGGAIDQGNRSGGNVTINTIDGTSSREWFERSGARQLNNARRVGRAPAWG